MAPRGVRGAKDAKIEIGGEAGVDDVSARDAKARDAEGRTGNEALNVGGTETSGGDAYRQATTGGDRGVGRGNAAPVGGVHGRTGWNLSSQGATAAPKDAPAPKGFFGRLFSWLGTYLDPAYAPQRYGDHGRYLFQGADKVFAKDEKKAEKETDDFWDEATSPDVLTLGARLNPFYDPVLNGARETMDRHFVFSKNANGEVVGEVRNPHEMIETGREVMGSWSFLPQFLNRGTVRGLLLKKLGLPEYSQLAPDAQKAVDRAVEWVLVDGLISDMVADHARLGMDFDREGMKREIVDRAAALGLDRISSDTEKAVDSILDHVQIAHDAGLLEVDGGFTVEGLSEVLTTLYVSGSPDVRIEKVELGHVPMVVRATMNHYAQAYRKRHGRDPKPEELKQAYLTALLHDAGKFDMNIRTTEGFAVLEGANFNGIPLNNTGLRIEVDAGETLGDAVQRLSGDNTFLDAMMKKDPSLTTRDQARERLNQLPLKKFGFLLGVMLHHDSANTKKMADALGADFEAIQAHGGVSSFILDNAFGGWGIQSNVFKEAKYQNYIQLFLAVHERIKNGDKPADLANPKSAEGRRMVTVEVDGKQKTLPLWKVMKQVRAEFADYKTFDELDQSLLTADDEGQADVPKYMDILSLQPVNSGATVHELLFGRKGDTADYMTNSVMGVLDTHDYELQTLAPDLSADSQVLIDEARRWLEQDLAATLLNGTTQNPVLKAAYGTWLASHPGGRVMDWIKDVRIKDEIDINGVKTKLFPEIKKAIEQPFATHMRNWVAGRAG